MSAVPTSPKIYPITHVNNLQQIIASGGLVSDARIAAHAASLQIVGMAKLKTRRFSLPVSCHPGDVVADYVPFYFSPCSVMLYLMSKGNHPELTFKGPRPNRLGQAIQWANAQSRWAFSSKR